MEELHCGIVLEVEEPSLIDLSSHGCKQGMVELDEAHRCTFSVDRSVVERTHGSTHAIDTGILVRAWEHWRIVGEMT